MKNPFMHRDTEVSLRKNTEVPNILFAVLLILMIAASVLLFITCTPDGVGLVSDSVNYINGARSISEGKGYYRQSGGGELKAITNFPPLYSIMLSIPLRFGMGWQRAAWWVSLVFFVFNTILIIRLVWLASGSRWAGLLAAVLFLCMQPYLYFQFYAMSEPVYYFCTFLAFILMLRGFHSGNFGWWLGCGIACGGAFLARYIGIVSLCAIFGAVLIFCRKRRNKAMAGLFCGALPLIASWLIRNALTTGNASNRQVLPHWVTVDDLRHGVVIFWRWLLPSRYGALESPVAWMIWGTAGSLLLSVLLCILLMFVNARRSKPFSSTVISIWTYLLFNAGYLVFVILTISLFDASVNIEERILFPAFMLFFMILPIILGWLLSQREYLASILPLAALLFFSVIFAQDTFKNLDGMAEHGYGWGWGGWDTSPAMNIIRELPEEKIIYTNQIEAVSLWTGRGAYALLDPVDPSSEQVREGYEETMKEIRRQVHYGESVLVFFGIDSWLGDEEDNWIVRLCEDLPFIYQDSSEWVVGKPGMGF